MSGNSKNNLIIRDYHPEDYEKILPLWESLDLGRPERGDNQIIIRDTLSKGGKLLILEDHSTNELIGTSWITNDQRRLYLHHFGIAIEHQGKGYAHLLMDATMDFARETGLQIKLEVHQSNEKTANLYKKYGFDYLGDYDVYIIRSTAR